MAFITSNLKIPIDGEPSVVMLCGTSRHCLINTVYGSESGFVWETIFEAKRWLEEEATPLSFRCFPDSTSEATEGNACAIVLGLLPEAVFFGYQGFPSFWGGTTSREALNQLFEELLSVHAKATSESAS